MDTEGKRETNIFSSKIIIRRNIIHFLHKITKSRLEKINAVLFFQMQGLISSQSTDNERIQYIFSSFCKTKQSHRISHIFLHTPVLLNQGGRINMLF